MHAELHCFAAGTVGQSAGRDALGHRQFVQVFQQVGVLLGSTVVEVLQLHGRALDAELHAHIWRGIHFGLKRNMIGKKQLKSKEIGD